MNPKLLVLFLPILFAFCKCEDEEQDEDYSSEDVSQKVAKLRLEGAEYLQKVMSQLQSDRSQAQTMEMPNVLYTQRVFDVEHEIENYVTPVYNISGPTPVPVIEAEIVSHNPPPLSLSKEELLALYEAALTKASQLPFLQEGAKPPEELQHVAPAPPTGLAPESPAVKPALQGQMGSPVSGYYYYYFPITSFLKPTSTPPPAQVAKPTSSPPQQLHATITMMETPNKSMEPLFMAISGFIGMALMFFFSVLFVPKFGRIKPKNAEFKDSQDDMATFAQIILESMTGKDCSERLACEIARIFRGIKSNNKPLRVLEIILPPNMAQQISQIRKAAGKRAKCAYIACKIKKPKPPPQNQKHNQWKKKETPHDLWMKHFEKAKPNNKKPNNNRQQPKKPWNRKPPAKKP